MWSPCIFLEKWTKVRIAFWINTSIDTCGTCLFSLVSRVTHTSFWFQKQRPYRWNPVRVDGLWVLNDPGTVVYPTYSRGEMLQLIKSPEAQWTMSICMEKSLCNVIPCTMTVHDDISIKKTEKYRTFDLTAFLGFVFSHL